MKKSCEKIKYFIAHYPHDPKYWNIYPNSVDGVLISQKNLHTNTGNPKKIMKRMFELGIHQTLELPIKIPLMIDSGAFQYIDEEWEELPITPKKVLDIYKKLKVDIGVHLDWPITQKLSEKQVKKRFKTTIENAEITMDLLKNERYNGIKIMAVTQGISPNMHKKCANKYLELGYELIGIGGLAPISGSVGKVIQRIDAVLSVVSKHKNIKIHLFGIGAIDTLRQAMKKGIYSFDNATPTMAAIKGDIILSNPYRRFNVLKNLDEANGCIPCGCYACRKYGRNLLNRGKRDHNMGRAIHNYIHYKNSLSELWKNYNVRVNRARIS